ncbi:MAG: DUF4019 domain-containing protein [Verrucomicrobiota bacterium]|nr:DUF4019 domain-containing protein [Verrucomicrobiota bacterium]
MRTPFVLVIALSMIVSSVIGATPQEAAAQAVAKNWLALADAGNATDSYAAMAPLARQQVSAEKWAELLGQARSEGGAMQTRTLRSSRFASKSPAGRTGEFVFLEYDTAFEKGGHVTESVALMKCDDGKFHVVQYRAQ